ncbi:MAG: fimbrillin family protein [Muribaculaceae bacterium]|nr:fimbrillin family protein [Muribaculaceae bacterium]
MKKLILFAAEAVSLAACNNDDNYIDESVAAQISATIGKNIGTRASETSWDINDEIGVNMSDKYYNVKYVTKSGDGIFEGSPIYFKNKREEVTLTAYYPFSGTDGKDAAAITASTTAAFQTSEKQPEIDFLFASKENVTGADPKVKFDFSHKMSQLTFKFKNGSGADVTNLSSITIEGLVLDGTFNTADGVCAVNPDALPGNITISLTGVENEKDIDPLIVFPQSTADKTVTLKIKDSENQEYACSLNFENNRIESGNNYKWSITVNKTALSVSSSEIIDWATKEADSGASSLLPSM